MSNLPFLKIAKQKIELPDSKKEIEVRPYLAGEEKALLLAIESADPKEMQGAIKNLVSSCIMTKEVNIDKLSMVDLEFVFITLRMISVDKMATIVLPHSVIDECKEVCDVEVDLSKWTLEGSNEKKIILDEDDGIGVVMRSPNIQDVAKLVDSTKVQQSFEMIYACVDFIFDSESVYKNFSQEELKAWIDQLTEKQLQKLVAFFDNIPKIVYDVNWTCPACGGKEHRKVEGILNFL